MVTHVAIFCLSPSSPLSPAPPLKHFKDFFANCPYFPGLDITLSEGATARLEWTITAPGDDAGMDARVTGVSAGEVGVQWYTPVGASLNPPPTVCEPSTLNVVKEFAHTWWTLGEHAMLKEGALCGALARTGEGDPASETWLNDTVGPPGEDGRWCLEVVGVRTSVAVMWQDGEVEKDLDAKALRLHDPGPHTFFPNDLVREKRSEEEGAVPAAGVVVSMDPDTRMCTVEWLLPDLPKDPAGAATGAVNAAGTAGAGGLDVVAGTVAASVESVEGADGAGITEALAGASKELGEVREANAKGSLDPPPGTRVVVASVSCFDMVMDNDYFFRLGDVVTRLQVRYQW